jgi:hypothetical protein
MGVTVGVNGRSVVHKDSGGVTPCFPDVCLTQIGNAVVPIPYPNIAVSKDTAKGTKTITCDGNPICHKESNFSKSTGDEPGNKKGVASGTVTEKAEFVTWSFDTFVEGKNVERAFDMMVHNNKNTAPFPVIQPPIVVVMTEEKILCPCCGKPYE